MQAQNQFNVTYMGYYRQVYVQKGVADITQNYTFFFRYLKYGGNSRVNIVYPGQSMVSYLNISNQNYFCTGPNVENATPSSNNGIACANASYSLGFLMGYIDPFQYSFVPGSSALKGLSINTVNLKQSTFKGAACELFSGAFASNSSTSNSIGAYKGNFATCISNSDNIPAWYSINYSYPYQIEGNVINESTQIYGTLSGVNANVDKSYVSTLPAQPRFS